jgi:hypothetical protein
LNAAQEVYTLFELNAPVPAGLRKSSAGLVAWMQGHGVTLSKAQRQSLEPQVIAEEFFLLARDLCSGMGLHAVIGLIPVMIAGEHQDELRWNLFASVNNGMALVSTADLRGFSEAAGRPFEAGVGLLLVGAILVRSNPRLGYHQATRGCVLDYNADRRGLIGAIRAPRLCAECARAMPAAQKAAAEAMLGALRKMKRKSP